MSPSQEINRSYPSRLSGRLTRRRLLAGLATIGFVALDVRLGTPARAAQQTLPPEAIESADGAFFPESPGGTLGYWVRNTPGGPQFWDLYDRAGGHSWYGPPLSRAWDDTTHWYQLFSNALFRQAKGGGGSELADMVAMIVTGPPVSSSFSNTTKLEFDGWPKYTGSGSVDGSIQAFLTANPDLRGGAPRSDVRDFAGKRRNLFANVGVESVGGNVRLGVLGQLYRRYFEGRDERLPARAIKTEEFVIGTTVGGLADDLPGDVKGIDRGFGAVLASEEGVARGVDHMNQLGLWWNREQFIWSAMSGGYSSANLRDIATDRNFRVDKEVVGLLQFTPSYAGGGVSNPAKFNPPSGLDLPTDHPANTWGEFVRGVVASRRPASSEAFGGAAQFASSSSSTALNAINRWIPWNEPDICDPANPGFAWNGTDAQIFRLIQVAYDAMRASNPSGELIFPTLGIVGADCDTDRSGTAFFNRWVAWLGEQQDVAALTANNFYFHHVSLALHKEPERVSEVVRKYRVILDTLGARVGHPDPLAGERKIIVMETGLQDDSGLGAYFDDEDRAHFAIQSVANALVAGADEVALFKLVDFPLTTAAGLGARTAVRYLSHVTRQHPDQRKRPDIHGERVAFAYRDLIRIDLPGPGFVTTVIYNRDLRPRALDATFTDPSGAGGPIFTSDHVGNESTFAPSRQTFELAPPRSTFQAYGKTYAWVAGGTRVFRYPDTIRMETPAIPTTG